MTCGAGRVGGTVGGGFRALLGGNPGRLGIGARKGALGREPRAGAAGGAPPCSSACGGPPITAPKPGAGIGGNGRPAWEDPRRRACMGPGASEGRACENLQPRCGAGDRCGAAQPAHLEQAGLLAALGRLQHRSLPLGAELLEGRLSLLGGGQRQLLHRHLAAPGAGHHPAWEWGTGRDARRQCRALPAAN